MEKSKPYKRLMTINISACLLLILNEQPLIIDGIKIKVGSPRLRTYLKGTTCTCCGLKGTFFAVEACKPKYVNYHLNLYAITPEGKEIMMTSDHIQPKSRGGPGSLKNRQPMCRDCNERKGNKVELKSL